MSKRQVEMVIVCLIFALIDIMIKLFIGDKYPISIFLETLIITQVPWMVHIAFR